MGSSADCIAKERIVHKRNKDVKRRGSKFEVNTEIHLIEKTKESQAKPKVLSFVPQNMTVNPVEEKYED